MQRKIKDIEKTQGTVIDNQNTLKSNFKRAFETFCKKLLNSNSKQIF